MAFFWSFLEGFLFTIMLTSLVLLFNHFYKSRGIPPGPWGLPYLGYWPFFKNDELHVQLQNMMKKYGKVFSFRVTGRLFINLGSIKAIKEAHIKNADNFRQRCTDFNLLSFVFQDGVACQNGEPWKVLRRFFVSTFKEWGVNVIKNPLSDPITETIEHIVEDLRNKKGDVVNIVDLLTDHYSRMFHTLLFRNEALSIEEIRIMTNASQIVQTRLQGLTHFLTGYFSKYIILPLTPGNSTFVKDCKYPASVLKKVIKRHIQTFDGNNIRNCIDSYLKERRDRREKGDPTGEYFTDDALAYSLSQFTGDAVLDIAFFPAFFLKALLIYPEEQEKIYKELVEVVGSSRQPSLIDKKQLPYTNAFILEVTRISDFFPLFPSLECTSETVIDGYRIPKGSITVLNMWAAQHDEQVYEDPYKFNPSRFLSDYGKESLPVNFGVGKRACGGEALAGILMFLFVTTIVYNFKVSTPDKLSKDISVNNKELNVCFLARTHNQDIL